MESLHPLIVHFPIALLLSAAFVDLAARLLRRPAWHTLGLWNLCLGTAGAAAAVATGLQAEQVAKHSFEIWQVMEWHQRFGIATLILGLSTITLRLGAGNRWPSVIRPLTFSLMLGIVLCLCAGAHLGGRLVYELGVGGRFGAPAPLP